MPAIVHRGENGRVIKANHPNVLGHPIQVPASRRGVRVRGCPERCRNPTGRPDVDELCFHQKNDGKNRSIQNFHAPLKFAGGHPRARPVMGFAPSISVVG